jgi:glucose-6-phosphate isomerase
MNIRYQTALKRLQARAGLARPREIRALITEPDRTKIFCSEAAGLYCDFSRSPIDQEDWQHLLELAEAAGLAARREAMFLGEAINTTENRRVWHTLLRAPSAPVPQHPVSLGTASAETQEAFEQVQAALAKMRAFCAQVHQRKQITDVVHIGIGGSYLGPELVVQALKKHQSQTLMSHEQQSLRVHFVANVDPYAWDRLAEQLSPETTLVILASKSWTTQETARNAKAIRAWFEASGMPATAIAEHWVAVTSRPDLARTEGLHQAQIFPFADWVGGRFSLWSAIGLPIMLVCGTKAFDDLLAGAHAMDRHFRETPLARNAPVMMALLSLWHQLYLGSQTEAVIPYSQRLARLPAFLQQLQMESNGKRVDLQGQLLTVPSAAVVWGEPGTDSQHSFFQALHHSPQTQAIDFILVRDHGSSERAHYLQASALAQIEALSLGQPSNDPHREYPGNRPCLVVLMAQLNAYSLGALLALYEHKTAALGFLLNINSFDQFGVELGKVIAKQFESFLIDPELVLPSGMSEATQTLIQRLR